LKPYCIITKKDDDFYGLRFNLAITLNYSGDYTRAKKIIKETVQDLFHLESLYRCIGTSSELDIMLRQQIKNIKHPDKAAILLSQYGLILMNEGLIILLWLTKITQVILIIQ